jgi:hypothetical protein
MSLTSFLGIEDVKQRFTQEFPIPKFNVNGEIIAPPITKHYALVGTAFDYLLRFYLKKIYPNSITKYWVAEMAGELVDGETKLLVNEILLEARITYDYYLKTSKFNDLILETCIKLAQLDPIYRAGYLDPNLGTVDPEDMQDLSNLLKSVKEQDFKCNGLCMLNPTFGHASRLVGGADMDILLDDTLIDVKTIKNLELKRPNFNQLIGYYILYLIGGIDNAPNKVEINNIAIYYSRYALLYKMPIKDIISKCDLDMFIKWFTQRAKQEFNTDDS